MQSVATASIMGTGSDNEEEDEWAAI